MNWFVRVLIAVIVNREVTANVAKEDLMAEFRADLLSAYPIRFGRSLTRRERLTKLRRIMQGYNVQAKTRLPDAYQLRHNYLARRADFQKIRIILDFFKPAPRFSYRSQRAFA